MLGGDAAFALIAPRHRLGREVERFSAEMR